MNDIEKCVIQATKEIGDNHDGAMTNIVFVVTDGIIEPVKLSDHGYGLELWFNKKMIVIARDTLSKEFQIGIIAAAVNYIIRKADEYNNGLVNNEPTTVRDVYETLNDQQKDLLYYLIGKVIEDRSKNDE